MHKHALRTVIFDVRALPAGVYHVAVQKGNRTEIRQFKK